MMLNRHAESAPFRLGSKILKEVDIGVTMYHGKIVGGDPIHEKEIWCGKYFRPVSLKRKAYNQCVSNDHLLG